MDGVTLTIFAALAVVFVSMTLIAQAVASKSRRHMARRVTMLSSRSAHLNDASDQLASVRREVGDERFKFLSVLTQRYVPNSGILKARLARTGKNINVGSYIALTLILILLTSLANVVLFSLNPAIAILSGVAVGVVVPHKFVGFLGARRIKEFTAIFPDAIDLMVRGLKSGLPISESIASVAAEMADPVGVEFRKITEAVKFGQTLEDALWETAGRLDTPDFKFFVITLNVQKETGGNLAETLANLSQILRQRKQMKLKIKALSSEAKASAYILGSLPFVMTGLLFLINADYISSLFIDPRGHIIIGIGLVSLAIGVGTMFRMVRFEI